MKLHVVDSFLQIVRTYDTIILARIYEILSFQTITGLSERVALRILSDLPEIAINHKRRNELWVLLKLQ